MNNKPTKSQLKALGRMADFEGFHIQFPEGADARMRSRIVQNGWAFYDAASSGYKVTEAGQALLDKVRS